MSKQTTPELDTREARLAEVVKDLAQARKDWDELGRPMLTRGSTLEVKPHPYIKIIRDLEQMAERMARPLDAAVGGRPMGAQSAPDRVEGAGTEPPRLAAVA